MPVTCDPALVARMLRNLRSPCEEQSDNRRSLVEAQRTGQAAIVIIGLRQDLPRSKSAVAISAAAAGSRSGTQRDRTDDRVRPRSLYG